jgi:hypothetical protein
MRYIAALDYDHLDNGVFLTTLARSLSQQQGTKDLHPIIVHSDSKYTERIIQTGVMRDEATIRSVKDLNNRLVALFADEGVSTIGINPYQRNFITVHDSELKLDHSFLDTLPHQPVLLLSSLVYDTEEEKAVVMDLSRLITFLGDELNADQLFIFSKSDKSEIFANSSPAEDLQWNTLDKEFRANQIPDEFINLNYPVRLTTARDFNQIPRLEQSIAIDCPITED